MCEERSEVMILRHDGHMRGQRLLGNRDKRELHDLDHETRHCQIVAIIDAGHAPPLSPGPTPSPRAMTPAPIAWAG